MSRSEELREVANKFLDAHDAWMDAGDVRPVPDQSYWDHVNALVETYSTGDVPGDCRKLAATVGSFMDEVIAFDNRGDIDTMMPAPSFFQAVDRIRSVFDAPSERDSLIPLETIQQLDKEGVTPAQIALIYGFVNAKGDPEQWKVADELRNPGCHTGPGTGWQDPRVKAIEEREKTAERHLRSLRERRDARRVKPVAPETTKLLIQQDVSVEQIAEMKALPLSVVKALKQRFDAGEDIPDEPEQAAIDAAKLKGEPIGPPVVKADPLDVAPQDYIGDEDLVSEGEEELTFEEQVMQLHAEGHSNKDIADELETDTRTVAAVIKQAKAEANG